MSSAHQPFIKWYPTDWRADPRLRMCSLSARGLWIELIGYMHEGEPYGFLTINNIPPSGEDIAALVGRPLAEVRKAMAELESRQVFSMSGGLMFSRRMVRDKAKAEKDRDNGKGGGNPKLRGSVKGGVNPQDKAQIPEARDQIPEDQKEAAGAAPPYAFESGVVKLNQRDFEQWRQAFSHLDLPAELLSLTEWAGQQRSWFNAVKGALAKRNREVKAAAEREAPAPFKWNGIEGVI